MRTTTGITMAPWLHEEGGIASDPVNVLFSVGEDDDTLATVENALPHAGWIRTTVGDPQFIYFESGRIRENCQYEKSPSWLPSVPGLGNILFRYHLRLWYNDTLDSHVIGGVHLEAFSNGHEIISFDEAKREIAADFAGSGWNVVHDGLNLYNAWLDSRDLSLSGRLLSAIGRRSAGALNRIASVKRSTRDRFLGNGYATLISTTGAASQLGKPEP